MKVTETNTNSLIIINGDAIKQCSDRMKKEEVLKTQYLKVHRVSVNKTAYPANVNQKNYAKK